MYPSHSIQYNEYISSHSYYVIWYQSRNLLFRLLFLAGTYCSDALKAVFPPALTHSVKVEHFPTLLFYSVFNHRTETTIGLLFSGRTSGRLSSSIRPPHARARASNRGGATATSASDLLQSGAPIQILSTPLSSSRSSLSESTGLLGKRTHSPARVLHAPPPTRVASRAALSRHR